MPRLTFPFGLDGLFVSSFVGLGAAEMQLLQSQGAALPASVQVKGMFDTASTLTAVGPSLLAKLGATKGPQASVRTAAGTVHVHYYQISFTIYHPSGAGPLLTRVDWTVTSLIADLDDADILFGLDLMREIVFNVDGPGGTFTLDF